MESVRYEVSGHVATVTIDRPEARNALNDDVMRGLREAVARARADRGVRVLVLTGAGDAAFCAGADLKAGRLVRHGDDPAEPSALEAHHGRAGLAELFLDLTELGKPTIARVNGYALAGGFGLALACDIVVAADTAVFGAPEINVGLWPMMISAVLMRAMPPKVALELMMTGRRVAAAEAREIGFVNRVAAPGGLDAEVAGLAGDLAAKSPAVLRLGRDAFYAVADLDLRAALSHLQAMLTITTLSEDAVEGVRAFAEKRQPVWTGR